MTFLAPWALALGGAAAAGMVLLHLVAWQRPAAFVLPTTRFIPDQRTVVSRAATRPRDVLLLVVRVLLILAAATAFARPVLAPPRGSVAHVVLLDRSRSVSDPADAAHRAQAALVGGSEAVLIEFDTVARTVAATRIDSLSPSIHADGSLSAALAAARRAAADLANRSDSVSLVLVSPLMRSEMDSATMPLRARWPGGIRIEHVAAREDTAASWHLERALSLDDPLGPAMHAALFARGGAVTRVLRGPLSATDSEFVRTGGTVVRWDTSGIADVAPRALAAGENVVVALLGRASLPAGSAVIARWSDGTPAATEATLGSGCVREVGVAIPAAGDLPLHAAFQRIVRSLLAPCGITESDVVLDSTAVRRLAGAPGATPSRMLRASDLPPTPVVKWLLALALLAALAELLVRARTKQVMT